MENSLESTVEERRFEKEGLEHSHSFRTLRYYLDKKQAEMRCVYCGIKFFRRMSDNERLEYYKESKVVVDVRGN